MTQVTFAVFEVKLLDLYLGVFCLLALVPQTYNLTCLTLNFLIGRIGVSSIAEGRCED